MRHSLNFCGWKDRKNVAKDLKRVYQAVDDEDAAKALDDFEAEWGRKYPSIAPSWQRAWQEVNPFFAFPPAVRKIIYTTNAIESLNRVIRKTTKTRGSFPTPSRARKHALPGSGRGRDKADLLGDPQLRESRQMRQRMGCRAKPVRYSISRTVQ